MLSLEVIIKAFELSKHPFGMGTRASIGGLRVQVAQPHSEASQLAFGDTSLDRKNGLR